MRCKAVTIVRAGASACAIASEASSAIAAAIKSATSITLRMYSQASEMAAAASGVATTVPAVAARGLTGRITSAWLPRKVGTIDENQRGGALPSPSLSGRRAAFRTR
ncbi:type IV secretory pathway TrbL component [Bradyrhizobium sp. LB7.2]